MGSENYTLGRGTVAIAAWTGTTFPTGTPTSLGNCPEVTLTLEEETLDHYLSTSGIRSKDKSVTVELMYTLNIVTDEFSEANLALFMRGTTTAATSSDNSYIAGLASTDTEYYVKFTSANAAGPDHFYHFWRVKLRPSGDLALITEADWGQITLEGEGLKVDTLGSAGANPNTYYFKKELAGSATG